MLDIFPDKPFKGTSFSTTSQKKNIQRKNSTNSSHQPVEFKQNILNHIFESEFNGQIDLFIQDLDALQEKMIKKPSLALVQEYKQKIGFFLEKLLSHYQGQSFFKGGLQKRIELKIWHSVNEELELISKNIISKNIQGFQLLKNLGVIKGLILDLKIGKG